MQRADRTLGRRLGSVALRYGESLRRPLAGLGRQQSAGRSRLGAARRLEGSARPVRDVRMARVEAVLFLSREPLSSRKLAQLANLADGTEARTLVRCLIDKYNARGSAFQVEEVAGGFQLLGRAEFDPWLRRWQPLPDKTQLSGPAMETLAVVAYCQPVLRAEIEAIRGVQCGEILRQLMHRELVRISGRANELGRPLMYGTTKRFLQVFGLKHIDQLPRADSLRAAVARSGLAVESPPDAGHHTDSSQGHVGPMAEVSQVNQQDMPERLGGTLGSSQTTVARPEELKDWERIDGELKDGNLKHGELNDEELTDMATDPIESNDEEDYDYVDEEEGEEEDDDYEYIDDDEEEEDELEEDEEEDLDDDDEEWEIVEDEGDEDEDDDEEWDEEDWEELEEDED